MSSGQNRSPKKHPGLWLLRRSAQEVCPGLHLLIRSSQDDKDLARGKTHAVSHRTSPPRQQRQPSSSPAPPVEEARKMNMASRTGVRSYSPNEFSRPNRSSQLRESLNAPRGRRSASRGSTSSVDRRSASRTPSPARSPGARGGPRRGFGAPPPSGYPSRARFAPPPGTTVGTGQAPLPEEEPYISPGEAARLRLMRHPATRNLVPVQYERLLSNGQLPQGAGEGARSVADRLSQYSERHSEIINRSFGIRPPQTELEG
eukprot:Hpha_TRINITY_DN15226_c0_g4::TRINITY_DN15226_c0_g4_i1::g.65496::m.65496